MTPLKVVKQFDTRKYEMSGPPRKRQKLTASVDTETTEHDPQEGTALENQPEPTTPTRRASYLSPTKSSLARSHPHILAKSPKRGSYTEPRGKLLRQKLLSGRDNQDENTLDPGPRTAPRRVQNIRDNEAQRENDDVSDRSGFAEAIARSFQDAPAGQAVQIDKSLAARRSPLRTRQGPSAESGNQDRGTKGNSFHSADVPVPRLVRKPDAATRQQNEVQNEPDLPPTPVQLGIGPALDRPRGLASSSSGGSRSGSGRHRRRVRGRDDVSITSSPLKPKQINQNNSLARSGPGVEAEDEVVEEAPESDIENTQVQLQENVIHQAMSLDAEELPIELRDQGAKLVDLNHDLDKLRQDLKLLESLTDKLQQGSKLDINESTMRLLNADSTIYQPNSQSPDAHPSFVKDPTTYLRLFAPGNMHLEHKTSTTGSQNKLKMVHSLMVKAPYPWPSEAVQVSVETVVDVEKCQIESLQYLTAKSSTNSENLRSWIDGRLATPLHRQDVAGLFWGAGQYFEACLIRAKALWTIEDRYLRKNDNIQDIDVAKPDSYTVWLLYPYLHKTQIQIPSHRHHNNVNKSATRSGGGVKDVQQVMLIYDIDLTWTGEAKVEIDLNFTNVKNNAQKGAKEIFSKLLPTEGVVGAFERVWDLLGFGQDDGPSSSSSLLTTTRKKSVPKPQRRAGAA